MSCGHCQIKIKAELESNDYEVIKIDMDKNTVLLDAKSNEINKITRILDKINYVVDHSFPILDIGEHTIWDDKLDDESNYEIFSTYLSNEEISIVGFNEEEIGLILLCTETQLNDAVEYINTIKV